MSACDVEDIHTMKLTKGAWRNDPPLIGLQSNSDRNPKLNAKEQRQKLTEYFNSEVGSVPWQDSIISL